MKDKFRGFRATDIPDPSVHERWLYGLIQINIVPLCKVIEM
jgi:hypothetical protein